MKMGEKETRKENGSRKYIEIMGGDDSSNVRKVDASILWSRNQFFTPLCVSFFSRLTSTRPREGDWR